ncbi:MAG: UxaA family hydrolase [Rhodobacteraceae bacterium]|nr:UxaA family hydrolase [Paracoccaceae bacterium]
MSDFLGYHRPNGQIGIRNHLAVVSAMDNANPVARRIAAGVRGAVPVTAAHGRGQLAEDLEQHDRTLAGYGAHPNVAASLVVSLEPTSAQALAERIAARGTPVEWIAIQTEGGTVNATARGIRILSRLAGVALAARREPAELRDLVLGLECGGSDALSGMTGNSTLGRVSDRVVEAGGTVILSETEEIIGAEHLLAARASEPRIGAMLLDAVRRTEAYADYLGLDMAPLGGDNIRGGLTTTEEKSLGAIRKAGNSPLVEVIGYGERPSRRGFVFMDAPAPGSENTTALAASGAQMLLFNTGVGNPIGNPISPTIKVTGSPATAEYFADNIDVDVTGILLGQYDLDAAGDRLMRGLLEVANGLPTASERLGDTEITISRVDIGFLRRVWAPADAAGEAVQ